MVILCDKCIFRMTLNYSFEKNMLLFDAHD